MVPPISRSIKIFGGVCVVARAKSYLMECQIVDGMFDSPGCRACVPGSDVAVGDFEVSFSVLE